MWECRDIRAGSGALTYQSLYYQGLKSNLPYFCKICDTNSGYYALFEGDDSKNYAKYGTGLWKDSFDDMAKKTVLKLLLSKFGPLNTQLERAIKEDQTVDGEYDDNPARKPELTEEQEAEIVSDAEKLAEELESENGD